MKQEKEGPTFDGEVKSVMGVFCATARNGGMGAAEHAAAVHLVAAAAYLEGAVGPAKTKKILSATMASIG